MRNKGPIPYKIHINLYFYLEELQSYCKTKALKATIGIPRTHEIQNSNFDTSHIRYIIKSTGTMHLIQSFQYQNRKTFIHKVTYRIASISDALQGELDTVILMRVGSVIKRS